MESWLIEHEPTVRLSFFLGLIVFLSLLETGIPFMRRHEKRFKRWPDNLALSLLNTLLLKICLPVMAVGSAIYAQNQDFGLFNMIDTPVWLEIIIALILLDLIIYAQHVISHKIPLLWRLHKIHHTDLDVDVTTAVRFHPLEILLSMVFKMAVVVILGPAVMAVIIFEIALSSFALFSHTNLKIPAKMDLMIRKIIVTPAMHKIHHSCQIDETNSNYGFNLSIWDRIFGTYKHQPDRGYDQMQIGLNEHRAQQDLGLLSLILMPFRR